MKKKKYFTTEIGHHRGEGCPRAPHFGMRGLPASVVAYLCGEIFFRESLHV
jgi:hypothetical protein